MADIDIAIEAMAIELYIEILDLSMNSMVDLSIVIYVNVYQRVGCCCKLSQ